MNLLFSIFISCTDLDLSTYKRYIVESIEFKLIVNLIFLRSRDENSSVVADLLITSSTANASLFSDSGKKSDKSNKKSLDNT